LSPGETAFAEDIGRNGAVCPMHGPLGSEPVPAFGSIVTSNLRAVPASI